MRRQRAIALCVLSIALLNFPLLAIFSTEGVFLGIPTLFVYVFSAWLLCIGLAALIAESR